MLPLAQPQIAQLHKMQANLRLDESGIPAAPPAPPVPTATRPVTATRAEDQGPKAKAEYDYQVSFDVGLQDHLPNRRNSEISGTDGLFFCVILGGGGCKYLFVFVHTEGSS